MIRRWVVRVVAWGLRGGICDDHAEEMLRRHFPWRDAGWRWEVIGDAKLRNGQLDRREWRKA